MNNNQINGLKEVINKSHEKLKTAKIDFENQRYEDSVSRAYYCIFHIITACLLSKGLSFSSHKEVIGNFNREFIKTNIFPVDLSKKVQTLFEDRQTSDYNAKIYINKEKAEEDILYAQEIFNILNIYLEKIIK